MRLAKISGGVGFGFRNLGVNQGFPGRFRLRKRGRNFFGGGGSFSGGGTWAAAAATAPATPASAGTSRGGGQVQIGLFVRHKFSREDGGFARKCNGELVLLFHKQRQDGGVAVQKILFPDRADFAAAEKTAQAGQVKMFPHQRGVVAGPAKKIFAAAIAAEQAAAVNRPAGQLRFGAAKQFVHVLVGGGGVAALKLDRLPHGRQRAAGAPAG